MKAAIKTLSGTLAICALVSLTAEAQVVIINENFDTALSPGASFGSYTFGDTTSFTSGIVPGVGVGGTGGWQVVNNAASGSAGFSGVGAQYQNGGVSGNTSANLSDYTLSFDVKATAGSLNIQIQTWNGPGFGGGLTGTLNTAPANPGFGNDLTLGSSFTHYSLNLGNTSVFQGNTGMIPSGGTYQIAMQFNGGGPTPYANTMVIDNLMLTMATVPEPSMLALCALGAMGLIPRLRRKA